MSDTFKTPILDGLKKYLQEKNLRLHTPGHKGKSILPEDNLVAYNVYGIDVTEVPYLDDLHNPTGIIAKSEKLIAGRFGADTSYFLINGATAGIQASFLSVCNPGKEVLIPRNSHKSVLSALFFTGAKPVYIPIEFHEKYGIPLGVDITSIKKESLQNIEVVFNVRPTFEGITQPLLINDRDCIQIVDEAHGGHFKFSHIFPGSSIDLGGDYVVQGTHKTLGSLTQTGLLHTSARVDKAKLRQTLAMVQSTSPSYVLLASLELMRYNIEKNGERLIANCLETADYVRKRINEINGFHCLLPEEVAPWELDPTKIVIFSSKLNGYNLNKVLRENYGIQVEMAQENYVVAMLTINDTIETGKIFVGAIRDISKRFKDDNFDIKCPIKMPPIPPQKIILREALFADKRKVKIEESKGCISAETFCPYPPGIPVIYPGELITGETIEYIKHIKACGAHWQGFSDRGLNTILIVDE